MWDSMSGRVSIVPIVRVRSNTFPTGLANQLFDDLVDPDTGVCATTNTFDRGDVMKAITDWSINENDARVKILVPPEEVERLTSRFCASSLVVEIDQASVIRRRDGSVIADGQAEPTFATIELLECQQRIVSTVETGIGDGCGSVDPEIVEDTIVSAGSAQRRAGRPRAGMADQR